MRTPAGQECPHFYGDYYRGRNTEECRLLKLEGLPWTRNLCKSCPVPGIARANSCAHMTLKPSITRPFYALFQSRIQVTAYCQKAARMVKEPHIGCGECHILPFEVRIGE